MHEFDKLKEPLSLVKRAGTKIWETGVKLKKLNQPSAEETRLNHLSSELYWDSLHLLGGSSAERQQLPPRIELAKAWHDSVITHTRILRTQDRDLAIAALKSQPSYLLKKGWLTIGTGPVERIAVMEVGATEVIVLEKPPLSTPKAERSPSILRSIWYSLTKPIDIHNPPVVLHLATHSPLISDFISGFADLGEIEYYHGLVRGILQKELSPLGLLDPDDPIAKRATFVAGLRE